MTTTKPEWAQIESWLDWLSIRDRPQDDQPSLLVNAIHHRVSVLNFAADRFGREFIISMASEFFD